MIQVWIHVSRNAETYFLILMGSFLQALDWKWNSSMASSIHTSLSSYEFVHPVMDLVIFKILDQGHTNRDSVSVNETVEQVATTWSGAPADRGIAISRCPEMIAPHNRHSQLTDVFLGPGTTRGNVDILSSTPAPPNSQDMFAM